MKEMIVVLVKFVNLLYSVLIVNVVRVVLDLVVPVKQIANRYTVQVLVVMVEIAVLVAAVLVGGIVVVFLPANLEIVETVSRLGIPSVVQMVSLVAEQVDVVQMEIVVQATSVALHLLGRMVK